MKKPMLCALFALAFALAAAVPAFPAMEVSSVSDADFVPPVVEVPETLVIPDNDMLTDNEVYTLAEGSRYQVNVNCQFMPESHHSRPVTSGDGSWNHQRYICIHNTGSYPVSATAANNAEYCREQTGREVSWHFTVGYEDIWQNLPVNEKGWHSGGNYWGSASDADKLSRGWIPDATNSTEVGIETCVDGFPADSTASGEHWNSQEMYDWYENHFDVTATHLAMHVASLCVRMNFNPYTQMAQHYSSACKNCPMQMRYIFGTNAKFTVNGTYFKVFLDRMYDYYEAFGGSCLPTDTFQNDYYNPNPATVYHKGLYKVPTDTALYRAGNETTEQTGTVPADSVVDVKVVGFDWGKVVLADGTKGWLKLEALTYIGAEHDYGTYRTADGNIVNVTKIDGNTACYEGGSADIAALTRVYKVEVAGDTVFGAEAKYLASGESFEVAAVPPVAPQLFDIWETTNGVAAIADREAETTKVTVLNSDIALKASYRDKYYLTVEYGTGTGKYVAGSAVDITAFGMVGYKFTNWKLKSGSGSFADPTAYTTVFTIGEDDTVITAEYEISGTIDLTGLTNYALGKSYVTTWKGSAEIEYRSKALGDPKLKKLTDGVVATTYFSETPIYVGFMGTSAMGTFTIDLGESRGINKVVLRDIADNGGSFGDIDGTTIDVAFSPDGENFTPAENLSDSLYFSYHENEDGTVSKFTNIYTHSVDFAPDSGRYVRVSFKSGKYLTSITEIEVYGPTEQQASAIAGDANDDGACDNLDAALILQYDAGTLETIPECCDVNDDGAVDNLDAALVLQYDAGIIENF